LLEALLKQGWGVAAGTKPGLELRIHWRVKSHTLRKYCKAFTTHTHTHTHKYTHVTCK